MPKRGKNWSDYETASLLLVWKANLHELRAAKRNRKVYITMADALQSMDISRGPEEIMERMRTMTKIYKKEKLMTEYRGSSTRTWVFYDEMDSLLQNAGVDCDVSLASHSPEPPGCTPNGSHVGSNMHMDASDCEDEKFTEACLGTIEHGIACDVLIDTALPMLPNGTANDSVRSNRREQLNSKSSQNPAPSVRLQRQKDSRKTTNDKILELLELQLQSYNRMADGLLQSAREMIKMQQTIVRAIQADRDRTDQVPQQDSGDTPQSQHASPASTSENTGDSADFPFHQR